MLLKKSFFEKGESATRCGEMGERSSKWKEVVG